MRIASIRTVNGNIELSTPYVEEFVAALKVSIPHYARKWVPERKLWIIAGDQRAALLAVCQRYFDVLDRDADDQRQRERDAEAEREREQQRHEREQQRQRESDQRRRWQQEWEQQQRQQYRDQAAGSHAVLHLLPTAPRELVKAAYLCLAKLYHPDRGGDLATMQKLNHAYEKLQR